jgi:hypothetical protein
MYWIYLIIFVLVVFAPEYVRHGYFFLGEEDAESVLIFCLNILAFLLYLAKERALGRIRGEQKQTQQEKKFISRDLEDSYSYIGELNRKFEILKRSVGALPGTLATFGRSARDDDLYHPILDAVKILSKTDSVALYFAHVGERRIEHAHLIGKKGLFSEATEKALLSEKTRRFWLEDGFYYATSPKVVDHFRCGIVFPKKKNDLDDHEIFKILASEALFLFCLVRRGKRIKKKS